MYIDQFRGPIVWQEEKPRKVKRNRITHDESTAHIVEWVTSMNQWFQKDQGCAYKIMPYWSRCSVAFAIWNDETEKWKQARASFSFFKSLSSTQYVLCPHCLLELLGPASACRWATPRLARRAT